jgi:hypothetical protein
LAGKVVHPKLNTGKEFPSTYTPVFTALRRDKSAFIRFHVISARQVAPEAFGFQMVHDLPHPGLLPKEKKNHSPSA